MNDLEDMFLSNSAIRSWQEVLIFGVSKHGLDCYERIVGFAQHHVLLSSKG